MTSFNIAPDDKVKMAEEIISYRLKDPSLLRRALQLADDTHLDGNKPFSLLGDVSMKVVVVNEGLRRSMARAEMQETIQTKLCNISLAERGFAVGLEKCVLKNRAQGNKVNPKPMATTVEAILGAVFIDSEYDITAVEHVMKALGITWPE